MNVTDIVSGEWCELQYYYTLTKLPFGKKIATKAMKGGTKVHKKLEDEVHVSVQVDVTTKEDAFGVRLWNMIQGLRTLRETGMTREFELWGSVDGNIISGIIDQVHSELPEDAPPTPSAEAAVNQSSLASKFFITDIKTTGGKRMPSGVGLRPTKLQLFLYYRFLCDMADGRLDLLHIFERYGVDPDMAFSDSYLAQLAQLHPEIFDEKLSQKSSSENSEDIDSFIRHRTLRELIPLYQDEVARIFSDGSSMIDSFATTEYRARGTGDIVGKLVFDMEDTVLPSQLAKEMEWWRGFRRPEGVPIEEAFKCRICDFADVCKWRKSRDQSILNKAKTKLEEQRLSFKSQPEATAMPGNTQYK